LSKKIEEMVKSKEVYMDKALQAKIAMADKKNAINKAMLEAIQEDDNRKAAMEVRRLALEERKAMMELVADENRTMMMDPRTMDAFTEEWWDICGERRSWRGGGKSVFSVKVVVPMLVVVLPVLVMVVPVLVPMVVVTATLSLHELHDTAVMASFYVKCDNDLQNYATM
jgi:hypothetical protein